MKVKTRDGRDVTIIAVLPADHVLAWEDRIIGLMVADRQSTPGKKTIQALTWPITGISPSSPSLSCREYDLVDLPPEAELMARLGVYPPGQEAPVIDTHGLVGTPPRVLP